MNDVRLRATKAAVGGLVVVALLGSLLGCGATSTDASAEAVVRSPPSAKAIRVEVIELEASSATLELDLPGEVTGDGDAMLAAANGGFVESVLVDDGETVTKGQSLVRVDTALYAAQREQSEARRDQAQVDLKRLEKLGDLGAESQLAAARTQLRIAEADLSLASIRLSRAVVKAPFDGVVVEVAVEPGEAVPPGGAVARVIRLDPVVVTLSVSDRDVVSLAVGAPVSVNTAAMSEERLGVIARISPAADTRTRAFPVEIEVPNPDHRLLPGMIARVRAQRPVADEAMVIPQDWVVTQGDRRGVFVTKGDLAEWRDISMGSVIHDKVVVTKGLASGDRIVITGHRALVDGDPLIISREGRCCSAGRPSFSE